MRKNPVMIVCVILIASAFVLNGISVEPVSKPDNDSPPTRAEPNVSVNLQGELDMATVSQLDIFGRHTSCKSCADPYPIVGI